MNNNYTYFNPNPSFMRSVPSSFPINPVRMSPAPLPRFSSLLGSKAASVGAASTAASGASKITFSGILNGASKTLGVINQAIPVFYQVKPIWNNARTMFRVVKEINSGDKSSNNTTSNNSTNNTNIKSDISSKEKGDSSPTFFA